MYFIDLNICNKKMVLRFTMLSILKKWDWKDVSWNKLNATSKRFWTHCHTICDTYTHLKNVLRNSRNAFTKIIKAMAETVQVTYWTCYLEIRSSKLTVDFSVFSETRAHFSQYFFKVKFHGQEVQIISFFSKVKYFFLS